MWLLNSHSSTACSTEHWALERCQGGHYAFDKLCGGGESRAKTWCSFNKITGARHRGGFIKMIHKPTCTGWYIRCKQPARISVPTPRHRSWSINGEAVEYLWSYRGKTETYGSGEGGVLGVCKRGGEKRRSEERRGVERRGEERREEERREEREMKSVLENRRVKEEKGGWQTHGLHTRPCGIIHMMILPPKQGHISSLTTNCPLLIWIISWTL